MKLTERNVLFEHEEGFVKIRVVISQAHKGYQIEFPHKSNERLRMKIYDGERIVTAPLKKPYGQKYSRRFRVKRVAGLSVKRLNRAAKIEVLKL